MSPPERCCLLSANWMEPKWETGVREPNLRCWRRGEQSESDQISILFTCSFIVSWSLNRLNGYFFHWMVQEKKERRRQTWHKQDEGLHTAVWGDWWDGGHRIQAQDQRDQRNIWNSPQLHPGSPWRSGKITAPVYIYVYVICISFLNLTTVVFTRDSPFHVRDVITNTNILPI